MTHSGLRTFLSSLGPTLVLFLMTALYFEKRIGGIDAFSTFLIRPSKGAAGNTRHSLRENVLLASNLADSEPSTTGTDGGENQLYLVLGGSGFIGRRICKELVESSFGDKNTKVVSISRSGKPQSWSLGIGSDNDDPTSWSQQVEWVKHNISESGGGKTALESAIGSICEENSEAWNTTIVGCVGNVDPNPTWEGLWGLNFDDDQLLEENGRVYELFLNQTKLLRAEGSLNLNRCVLLSLDYTCQKCLEGPIEGYLDGKRLAERRLLEAISAQNGGEITDASNLERVVVIGLPNFVYGGKRFPAFGKIYRKFVESPIAKAYVGGNEALRSLSVAEPEDWLEAMLFLSPIDVEIVGRASAMAARGLVTRQLINNGEPRKQGFFNTSGLPVEFDDILFVDGTPEIEGLVGTLEGRKEVQSFKRTTGKDIESPAKTDEPLWESALARKRPYLYPFPVALFFMFLFWGIATQQFIEVVPKTI